MRVVLGMYISEDIESNDREMNALAELVPLYGHIFDAVIVGNEVLFFEWVRAYLPTLTAQA